MIRYRPLAWLYREYDRHFNPAKSLILPWLIAIPSDGGFMPQ
jgi:hypothetical protein